jgi:hypothetical protein
MATWYQFSVPWKKRNPYRVNEYREIGVRAHVAVRAATKRAALERLLRDDPIWQSAKVRFERKVMWDRGHIRRMSRKFRKPQYEMREFIGWLDA